jgi:hypothetical protein
VPGRIVTLVLGTADGEALGVLPPFDAPSPWWRDTTELVSGARERHGVDVVVLRLLSVVAEQIVDGGPATYLVQVDPADPRVGALPLQPWDGSDPFADDPLRMSWARPDGPQADVTWAQASLAAAGIAATGPPEQVRTWNLSSIWRLPTEDGPAWLKVVPPFFAHEGDLLAVLAAEDPSTVPELIGHDGPRMLLRDVPGTDRYDATGDELAAMVHLLVSRQAWWTGRTDDLLAMGVPDWRTPAFLPDVEALLTTEGVVDAETTDQLERLFASLPMRLDMIDECAVPVSLVHGDFHPGNVRGSGTDLRLLDWGDSGVGHALLDETAFCARLSDSDRALARATFEQGWRGLVPGSDPALAFELLAPVAALRAAVVYQRFLDAIEPSERVYHRNDPGFWLSRAADLAGGAD